MESANPFAQMPITPEPIIAQVRRQLADDAPLDSSVETALLDHVAERAVRELWGSRVKTFVPVLALREARAALREQGVPMATARPDPRSADEPVARRSASEKPRWDVLPIHGDVVPVDDRDVLSL
jgi:hypothetical protein